MIKYTNESILDGIKSGDRKVVDYVYEECFPTIKFLISMNSGNDLDAEDVFQDALVIVFQKVNTNALILTSSFKTFLYSICRNLWLQRLDIKAHSAGLLEKENLDNLQEILELDFEDEEYEKYQTYQKHFLKLGEDCQKVLKLFLNKTPLEEIADQMGFKSAKYAKTRKYLCKEKLKNRILNDPNCKKFFKDD